jgi:hypothetical protein
MTTFCNLSVRSNTRTHKKIEDRQGPGMDVDEPFPGARGAAAAAEVSCRALLLYDVPLCCPGHSSTPSGSCTQALSCGGGANVFLSMISARTPSVITLCTPVADPCPPPEWSLPRPTSISTRAACLARYDAPLAVASLRCYGLNRCAELEQVVCFDACF